MQSRRCENCGAIDFIPIQYKFCADCRSGMKHIPHIVDAMQVKREQRLTTMEAVRKGLLLRKTEVNLICHSEISFEALAYNELLDAKRKLKMVGDYAEFF